MAIDAVIYHNPRCSTSRKTLELLRDNAIDPKVVEYLKNGVALNAVNMPAMTVEQYRLLGPYVDLAERLGTFLGQIAVGNPNTIRFIYYGRLADENTQILRNAGAPDKRPAAVSGALTARAPAH